VFAINVLPIGATLWVLARLPREPPAAKRTRVDILGAVLCAAGLGGVIFALIEYPSRGGRAPEIWGSLAGGIVALAGFLAHERRAPHPMLDLGLFRHRNFAVGNLATAAVYAGLTASSFVIPVFLQQVARYGATAAGLALMPVTIMMFALSPLFGRLSAKHGPRLFMSAGPAVAAAGFVLMSRIGVEFKYARDLLPGVLVFGLGLSMTVAPLTAAILSDIDERHAGVGSAVNNAVARVAGLLAVAAVGMLGDASLTSFRRGLGSVAALLMLGGLISAAGIRNRPGKSPPG
jgi:predicted MFS family arabinose efflux permease